MQARLWAVSLCASLAAPRGLVAQPAVQPRSAVPSAPAPKSGERAELHVVLPVPQGDTHVPYPEGGAGSADVFLELVINVAGKVESVVVIEGEEPFASTAKQHALSWQFVPARRGAEPIAARIRFLVQFEQAIEQEPVDEPGVPEAPRPPSEASVVDRSARATAAGRPQPPAEPVVQEVTVEGQRKVGAKTLSRSETRQLPGAFGDPFRAIESLPGVTPIVSGAPYFYVRGAPPGNVGYFFDGVRVPTLFHIAGGPGNIHPAFVTGVDLYAGPYPARYGRFAGGIVAGTGAAPEHRLRGELVARAIDSALMLEVPLFDQRVSVMAAGRYSYAQPIVSVLAPEISLAYWDYQGKLTYALSPRDTLTLFAFGSSDFLSETESGVEEVVFDTEFHRFDLRYDRRLDDGALRVAALVGRDVTAFDDSEVQAKDVLTGVRARLSRRLSESTNLLLGADAQRDEYDIVLGPTADEDDREEIGERFPTRSDYVTGAFAELEVDVGSGVRVMPGLRSDFYVSGDDTAFAVAPRLMAEFEVTPSVTLTHGVGVAFQPPSFFIPTPGFNPSLNEGLQSALQSSAGLRLHLPYDIAAEATLFQSAFFNLTDGPGVSRLDNGDSSIDEDSRSIGSTRGFELMIKRAVTKKLGGYLAYTLASSRRELGRVSGPALFDRRHVLGGALSYQLGSGWRAGVRGTLYTGIPADVAYIEAAENPPRTPPFYRFDWRVEKRWLIGEAGAWWAIVAEVLNTTLNEEVLQMSCNAYVCKRETIGPVTVPSIGVEAAF